MLQSFSDKNFSGGVMKTRHLVSIFAGSYWEPAVITAAAQCLIGSAYET